MDSIIKEITKLRRGRPFELDRRNSNKYRIVACEEDGSKTSYCFGVPIYNEKNNKLTELVFKTENNVSYSSGSNTEIAISDYIMFYHRDSIFRISVSECCLAREEKVVRFKEAEIYPTLNGIAIKADCLRGNSYRFTIHAGRPFMDIRANNKSFSLMNEKFTPFITVSCIGSLNLAGQLISPAILQYQKLTDREYSIEISSSSPFSKYVMFEINVYEIKLFQDTTVESADPVSNNVFGGTAYIGNTAVYGEQWLYSRPDFSRIPEIMGRRAEKVLLNLPQYNRSNTLLTAHKVSSRFCSFGSNWDNKVSYGTSVSSSELANGYQRIDVTDLMTEEQTKCIIRSDGLILKPKVKDSGFTAVSTGDSYFAPQIFEINFR